MPPAALRFRPGLHALEDRALPAPYMLTPVVPDIDAAAQARLTAVVQAGAANGNRLDVFAAAGDSITRADQFLVPLARPSAGVDQAGDGALNDTLAYFRGTRIGADNSFSRRSDAARGGYTSADVAARLAVELSITRPAFVLVMVGTNDNSAGVPLDVFRANLTAIVQTALNAGTVPVLSTIPDIGIAAFLQERQPGYNQVIQDVADAAGVPVWNYWRALQRVPGVGLSADGVHPSAAPGGGGDLTATGLGFGYNVRNLTALQTLDKLRRVLLLGQSPDLPGGGAAWVPLSRPLVVEGGAGNTGFQVEVIDAATRQVQFRFDPFPGFGGPVRTAVGDMTGDGVPDLVAVPGPGAPPHVKVFDGRDGSLVASFFAFDTGLSTGLNVALGDTDGDGRADIVVSPQTGVAHVTVFSGGGALLASFYAFDPSYRGGAQVTAGDVDGDGRADVIAAANGHVVAYSLASGTLVASFMAFAPNAGPLGLAAGDTDGDGLAEIAVGASNGHVKVFRAPDGAPVSSFLAYGPGFNAGMQIALLDRGTGRAELFTAAGGAALTDARAFDPLTGELRFAFVRYETGFRGGATLGG